MSFSKHNIFLMIIVAIIIAVFSSKLIITDSYLGRALFGILIIIATSFNIWFGLVAVIAAIVFFRFTESFTSVGSFTNVKNLFNQQNHLQKHVYYVPKRREAPIPQNDTDYVPLNPMQSKAGAIQPSQPSPILKHANKTKTKTTGNSYQHLLRIQEMVRPKSSKSMGIQTGLNKDYEPQSNWPDGNAFKNPYSAAEN